VGLFVSEFLFITETSLNLRRMCKSSFLIVLVNLYTFVSYESKDSEISYFFYYFF